MSQTLLLNADARPLTYLPISTVSWQEAIKCLYLGAAEVLHAYDDWQVHSPSVTVSVPAVMILKEHVRTVRTWTAREDDGPQKHLVFLRDMFVCQYCHEQFARRHLTLDHVVPKYHGGRTRWDNLTTACAECNCKRGHDMDMQPRVQPFRPTYGQLIKNLRQFPINLPHEAWNYYLQWPEHLIKLRDPRKGHVLHDNFDIGVRISLEFN